MRLPQSGGREVLQEIPGEFADLPVAVCSSSESPEEKNRIAAVGATFLLTKPMGLDEALKVGKRIKDWPWQRERREGCFVTASFTRRLRW